MSTKRRLCLFVAAAFIAASTTAQDIETLWEGALETDSQLKMLDLTLKNRRLSVERSNLPERFSLTLGTGKSGLVISQTLGDAPATAISIDPTVSVTLGESLETSASAGAGISFSSSTESDGSVKTSFLVLPTVSVSQPLNPLLGLEPSEEVDRLSDYQTIKQAEINVAARGYAVRKSVVSALRSVVSLSKSVEEHARALDAAVEGLQNAVKLETYGPESADFRKLELAVNAARRKSELIDAQYDKALADLERVTGLDVDELPASVPDADLRVPADADVDRSADVFLARLGLQRSEAQLAELERPHIPQYSVGVSYAASQPPGKSVRHTVGGSISAGFKNVTMSGSVSTDITAPSVGGTVKISWSLPDKRRESIDIESARNSVASAEIQLESTISNVRRTFEGFQYSVLELSHRRQTLQDDMELAELQLQEKRDQLEQGVIAESVLEEAQWNLEKLKVDELLLDLDELLLSLDIGAATFMDSE